MDEENMERVVRSYLKRKGFKATELALQQDTQDSSNNDSSLTANSYTDNSHFTLSSTQVENDLARHYDGYSKLRSWTYNSLDLYKHELLRVLYPVFIHCFMDLVAQAHIQEAQNLFYTFHDDHEMIHMHDLQMLEGVLSPSHLEEMEFARTLRQSKTNIKICQYSYDLLLQYLHKTQSTTILEIINEHITFQVSPGHPSSISDDTDVITSVGGNQDAANQINQREIRWGLLEDCFEDRLEKTRGFLSDTVKTDVKTKDEDVEDNKKLPAERRKQGASVKKLKKGKATSLTEKPARSESNSVFTAPRVKPKLALPVMSTEVELSILEDLRNRVQLNSVSLPSISFYTFINTHNGLNCSAISRDGSLVAGGFSDSSLKVWDMAMLGQQMNASSVLADNETTTSELRESDGGKRPYTLLQGHFGPVYSATFSPLGDYILSASADSTIRLWSTKLNANLVCYKSHNYPVWDVQFNPWGSYFVSCSHDRTARLWSMDRMQPIRIMAGHVSDVDCVQWHANCNYIATGSSDKTVRLWDIQTGECVRIFIGHKSVILSLACSPDGHYMASGDGDGAIMMWDITSGRCITPLVGHASCVWSLVYSCEGSLLASGSADCTVKLWDVASSMKVQRSDENNSGCPNRLRCLKSFPTKSTPVYSLQFSRRNLLFAAGALSKGT